VRAVVAVVQVVGVPVVAVQPVLDDAMVRVVVVVVEHEEHPFLPGYPFT